MALDYIGGTSFYNTFSTNENFTSGPPVCIIRLLKINKIIREKITRIIEKLILRTLTFQMDNHLHLSMHLFQNRKFRFGSSSQNWNRSRSSKPYLHNWLSQESVHGRILMMQRIQKCPHQNFQGEFVIFFYKNLIELTCDRMSCCLSWNTLVQFHREREKYYRNQA